MKELTKGSLLRYVPALLVFFCFASQVHSQPSGIFSADDVALWLIADSNVTATSGLPANDGEEIDSWTDIGNNGFVAARVSNGPLYTANGGADFNNHAVITFDNTQRYLSVPDDNELDGGFSGLTVIVVYKRGATDTRALLMKRTATTSNRSYGVFYNTGFDLYGYFDNGNSVGGIANIPLAGSHISTLVFDGTLPAAERLQISLDGGTTASQSVSNTTVPNYTSDLLIGLFNPGDTRYLNGDQIAEILILQKSLGNAERIILENYFNEKYGSSIAVDYFTGNDPAYISGFTGVGQEADGAYSASSSEGLYLEAISGLDNGEYALAAHDGTVNTIVVSDLPAAAEARWARDWYIEKTGGFNSRIAFDLSEGINGKYPQEVANYTLLYRAGTSGSYSEVTTLSTGVQNGDQIFFEVNNANFLSGYYTLASIDTAASPLDGADGRSWYTLISGDWEDPFTWTLDPSGTQWVNPDNYTPTTSPTSLSDKVYILSGRTVTVSSGNDNKMNALLKVDGRLDLTTTSGHSFGEIMGGGRILMASDNFPAGDATHFSTAGQGEGTAVYYGAGYSLTTPRTLFDVEVDMDAAGNILTLIANYTINGDLTVQTGELQINDGVSTTPLTIDIAGNWLVQSGATVSTGNANVLHTVSMLGSFTNYGTALFTNRVAPNYNAAANDGAVHMVFNNAAANQSVNCFGTTNFYRIVIDKGTDKTYILDILATNSSYFNLFGPANDGHGSVAQLSANDNALALLRGTVRIGTNVNIPVLNNTGNYNISEAAQLWVNGGYVAKNQGTAIVPYGTARVSSGTFEALVNSGFTTRDNGTILIEGGTLNTYQIRTSVLGAGNVGGYVQTGGTANIVAGNINNDYYKFNLTYPGNVFQMTGGTLHVHESRGRGGIFINSDPENVNVTGGTVICEISTAQDFIITSRAPFFNVTMLNSAANANVHLLAEGVDVGATDVDLAAQPLVVKGTLNIGSNAVFDHDGYDVSIGANFMIQPNGDYIYSNGKRNTTTINGSGNSLLGFYNRNDVNGEQRFWRFVIDKPAGRVVSMASSKTNVNGNNNNLLRIDGTAFIIRDGILDNGLYSVRFYTDTVAVYGTCGVYNPANATPDATANGNNDLIKLRPDPFVLLTDEDSQFGNVRLNSGAAIVTLNGDIYMQRLEWRFGRMDLGTHNLRLDELYMNLNPSQTIGGNPSVEDMFITAGNASDGGLTLYIPATGTDPTEGDNVFEFPLGMGTDGVDVTSGGNSKYTPALLTINGISDDGYVTIRPVDDILPTTNPSGNIISYYWRVGYEGFSTLPTVEYQFTYNEDDTDGNNDSPYRPGKVLDDYPYTRSSEAGSNLDATNNIITFDNDGGGGFALEKANYTAGQNNRFIGTIDIFYTRDHGNSTGTAAREPRWHDRLTWTRSDLLIDANGDGTIDSLDWHDSRQPAVPNGGMGGNEYPQEGDIAVIGWVPWEDPKTTLRGQPHGVWIDNRTNTAAEVRFTKMRDAAGNPVARVYRSNFQFRPTLCINWTNGNLDAGLVRGEGMFWNRNSDPDFTLMDFGEFATEDSAYVVYESWANPNTINNTPSEFPNLIVATDGWGGNNKDLTFSSDISTNGNFELLGDVNLVLSNGVNGNITVGRDLKFVEFDGAESPPSGGGAELAFQNNGNARTVTVNDDIILNNTGAVIHVRNPNSPATDHIIDLYGDYVQSSAGGGADGLQLYSADDQDRVTLYLRGNENTTFIHNTGDVPNLYRLIVNKGSSQLVTATIPCEVTLGGPTNTANKALVLSNGSLILNHPAIDFTLSSGGGDFLIPASAALRVQQGRVEVTGNNTGILLDGLLQIDGGTVDLGTNTGNGNNYIEYSASGSAQLIVNSGSLTVGSQIRRGLSSDVGVIDFRQSGGTVIVGENAAPEGNRGVFEVIGALSRFTHTNGDLFIVRQQTSPTVASFYVDAGYTYLAAGTSINLGNSSTPANQDMGIYTTTPLKNLRINNSSGNNPTVTMKVVPLTLEEDLTIDAGADLDAAGLDLTLRGDLINSGTFIPNGNTTYFEGAADQTITGNTDFYNLIKPVANNLILSAGSSDILVQNDLDLQGGQVTDNDNSIYVQGDCNMDAIHNYGGSGEGIELNGILQQELSGNGTFGKLAINNANGVFVPLGNNITVSDVLRLESGVFDIGKNLLDLEVSAIIENGAPFGPLNMIQTNISFTDNGVRKTFPSGAGNFVFPMGSAGKYTPVNFSITANANSTGSITVKPANEMHPSITEDAEVPPIVDADNVLQYHWVLRSTGISGFSGTARMTYIPADALVTTPPYTVNDYITARLLSDGSGNWNKYPDVDKFDEVNRQLIFDFMGVDSDGISGDYTAGITDAIPDVVPVYETETSGDWTNGVLWDPDVTGGPRGAIARINAGHTIDATVNFLSSYQTEIYGRLNVNTTFGHRLGIVDGTGLLYSEREVLPAGDYDDFLSASGGTVEFGGNADIDVLGGFAYANNLILSGNGERRLPNSNLLLYGDLTLNGSGSLSVINEYDRNLTIHGDLERISGVFDAGSGSSKISLSGSSSQSISGGFTGTSAFNILEINNAAGIVTSGTVEVADQLQLTNGVLQSGNDTILVDYLADISPAAGTAGSYVDGNLTKELFTGQSFTFPIGNGSEKGNISVLSLSGFSGIQNATSRYRYSVPPSASSFSAPIQNVSLVEYWEMAAPSGSQANLRIDLDGSSDIANTSDLDSIRLVTWNGAEWVITGGPLTATGTAASGTLTTTSPVSFDGSTQLFALASIQTIVPASASFSTGDLEICAGASATLTVILTGDSPWDFSYSDGSTTFDITGHTQPTYDILVSPASTTTYTLVSVADNNGPGTLVGNTDVVVTVHPLPVPLLSGNANACEGETGVIYTTDAGNTNYVWTITAGGAFSAGGGASDNSATVTWNGTGVQTITVNYTTPEGCTAASVTSLDITVSAETTPVITGVDTLCVGATGAVYDTDAGMTGYTWIIGAEGTITSGGGATDNSVTITWNGPVGTSSVSVSYTDANSCPSTQTDQDVELMPVPVTGPANHIEGAVFQ